jgi:hypothetical protein
MVLVMMEILVHVLMVGKLVHQIVHIVSTIVIFYEYLDGT